MGNTVEAIESEPDENGKTTIIGYDITWTDETSKTQILEHLKYLEYLSKWDGKLPEVVAGENTSIMFPIN